MKNILSCSTHSYHGYSFERALEGIAASGLKYVELGAVPGHTEHVSPEKMGKAETEVLEKTLATYGLTATSISGHCNMATKEGVELFKKRLDLADALGVKYVNTAEGEVNTKEAEELFYVNMREVANYNRNVFICLETHGGLLGTSESCKRTLEFIGCDNVRINYDPANLVFFEGARPEEDICTAVALIGHFHIKDKLEGKSVWNFPEIGAGYLDFKKMFSILKKEGYAGPLSFELEFTTEGPDSPEFVDQALKNSVMHVEQLLNEIAW